MESPSPKRLQSFGSSSSSSSSCSSSFRSAIHDISPLSPSSPSFHISSVPFSWEQHPGIPKEHTHLSSKSIDTVLPLPPSAGTTVSRRFNFDNLLTFGRKSGGSPHGNLNRDPFAVALVECSKDTDNDHQQQEEGFEKYWKVSRVVSDRFGFIDRYTSCKKSCAVAESVILLPRSIRKASS